MDWGLERPANCTFCNRHLETNVHLFADCSYTNIFWAAIGRITGWVIQEHEILQLEFRDVGSEKEAKIILVSLANHTLWKQRNEIKHNPGTRLPNQFTLIRKIWSKVKGRLTFERRRPTANLTTELGLLQDKFNYFFSNAWRELPP